MGLIFPYNRCAKEQKVAEEIVGNKTYPYLRAQKIYWNIMETLPSSKAPHTWLDDSKTPESPYSRLSFLDSFIRTGIKPVFLFSMRDPVLCRSLVFHGTIVHHDRHEPVMSFRFRSLLDILSRSFNR